MKHDHVRRAPPWWPSGEAWPPAGPHNMRAWRQMRGGFFWRIGVLIALIFCLAWGGMAILVGMAAGLLGIVKVPSDAAPIALVLAVIPFVFVMTGLTSAGRALRRMTRPVAEVIDATGRVAEGDYSVRVAERGPRYARELARAFNSMAERLAAHDELRRNMLADVTHELRTPLTVIQGNLEGLLDGIYPRDDAHLQPILEETRVLSRVIDDLRTLALAESGALHLEKEPVDLAVLAGEAAASFRGQAGAAGVELVTEAAPDLPMVEADPARIRQVLDNLIANALRYTSSGGTIRVACQAAEAADGARQVTITVSDTGAGIPPDRLPHIFDRFYKSADSRGAGLGLAIAKNLVAVHGGQISVSSTPGQGTSLRFTLPIP